RADCTGPQALLATFAARLASSSAQHKNKYFKHLRLCDRHCRHAPHTAGRIPLGAACWAEGPLSSWFPVPPNLEERAAHSPVAGRRVAVAGPPLRTATSD